MKQPYERLNEMIEILGITQTDIVERTGLPKSLISMYVNNKREPRSDKVSLIANAFNVDPVWLMGFDVPMFKKDAKELAREYFELEEKYKKLNDRDKQLILSMMDNMIKAYE